MFWGNQRLKLYIILSILHFIIYQTLHSFPNKCIAVSTTFHKCFWYNKQDKGLSSLIFNARFDYWCANVASSDPSIINRYWNQEESLIHKRNFNGRKRVVISCVIIPWWRSLVFIVCQEQSLVNWLSWNSRSCHSLSVFSCE